MFMKLDVNLEGRAKMLREEAISLVEIGMICETQLIDFQG